MSIINSQGGYVIDCRECDSPDCRGCNIYTLAAALGQGKFDWMMDEKHTINPELCVPPKNYGLDLDKDDCENVAEFIEEEFFNHMYNLMRAGDLDNVGYIRSIIRAMDALYKAAGKELSGLSYMPEVEG